MRIKDFKNPSNALRKAVNFLNKNRAAINQTKNIYGPYFIYYLRNFISFPKKTFNSLSWEEINFLINKMS